MDRLATIPTPPASPSRPSTSRRSARASRSPGENPAGGMSPAPSRGPSQDARRRPPPVSRRPAPRPLPERTPGRRPLHHVSGAEQAECLADPLSHLVLVQPELTRCEGHILFHGRGKERRFGELEDEPHPPPQLVLLERARVHAVNEHLPARGSQEQIEVLD